MKKTIFKLLVVFLIGILGGVFAIEFLGSYINQGPTYVTEEKEVFIQENSALQNSVEKVEKAVVGIVTKTQDEIFQGSGLILTSDGLIVTLADLVPQGTQFTVIIEGQSSLAQVLKRDLEKNLALIKVEKTNLATVGFADLGKLKTGTRVFLIGVKYPLDKGGWVANEGIVKYIATDLIETNMFETASFAGTPLFNIEGEFLGLNNVDFWGRISAIPVNVVRTFAGF